MEIKRFIGGSLEANCYIVSEATQKRGKETDSDKSNGGITPCYIIDPGYNHKSIIRYVRDKELDVKGIILTHHHYDHSEAAEAVKKELGCPIMIHRLDADMLKKSPDVYLEDGDVLRFGEEKFVVMHTPGHTRGGICLYSEKSRVCFTGDTVFNVDLGRTDLSDGSEAEMIDSIRNVVDRWENDITVYAGHGDPATMKKVRKINREFIEIVER